jgi:hypothetical protein
MFSEFFQLSTKKYVEHKLMLFFLGLPTDFKWVKPLRAVPPLEGVSILGFKEISSLISILSYLVPKNQVFLR